MNVERINTYRDPRFSQGVLNQHGCFLVEGEPYEVEIISTREAVVRGRRAEAFPALIEEFRFYTPHITTFFDENHNIVDTFPPMPLLTLRLEGIQPSQFYVDLDKMDAVREFIRFGEDIIIQVLKHDGRYIALDGHTRLYYAVMMGWTEVRAVEEASGDYIFDFVEEARRRNIRSPFDLEPVDHNTYEQKWNRFCDDFFAQRESGA